MNETSSASLRTVLYLVNSYISGHWQRVENVFLNGQKSKLCSEDQLGRRFAAALHALSPASVLYSDWQDDDSISENLDYCRDLRICASQLRLSLTAMTCSDWSLLEKSTALFCFELSRFFDRYFFDFAVSELFRRHDTALVLTHSLKRFHLAFRLNSSKSLPSRMTVVLGMHRSGTSALSGMLAQAGLEAPNDALGATDNNLRGYWESESLVSISDSFLRSVDSHWSELFKWSSAWWHSSSAFEWTTGYLEGLSEAFDCRNHIVLKDPRLCILFEGLIPSLLQPFIKTDFILIMRSPVEVVASLCKAEVIDIQDALNLWIASVLRSEYLSRDYPRLLINFPQLLTDPGSIFDSCCSLWGESAVNLSIENALEFVQPSLHRQKQDRLRQAILESHPKLHDLLSLAESIYELGSSSTSELPQHFDRCHCQWLRLRLSV